MKYTYTIIFILVFGNCLKSQNIPYQNTVILDDQTLYVLQSEIDHCPSVHRQTNSDASDQLLWISSSNAFNSSTPIWDINNGIIYTLSVINYKSTVLIGLHKTTWNALADNNKKFAESSKISENINNWPNDNFRMEVGSLPFRDIKKSILTQNALFADINVDNKLTYIVLDTAQAALTMWELDINPKITSTEGNHIMKQHGNNPKTNKSGASWRKVVVFENVHTIEPNFQIYGTNNNEQLILVDDLGAVYSIHTNGIIKKEDIHIKPSTIFVKDKNNRRTYLIDKSDFDQIIDSYNTAQNRMDMSLKNLIKSECYFEF